MMRKREKELEAQLAAKAEELKTAQQELDKRLREIQELQRNIESGNEQIKKLHARESDVISAMAEIENMRARKLDEANRLSKEMTDNAQKKIDEASEEAERIMASAKSAAEATMTEARERSAKVIDDARAQADNMLAQAESTRQDYLKNTREMNDRLYSVGSSLKDELKSLEDLLERLGAQAEPEGEDDELQNMRKALHAEPVETPESYENPADLMKNIYAIEQRDIPSGEEKDAHRQAEAGEAPKADAEIESAKEETKPEEESPKEDRIWTVDEIVDSVLAEDKNANNEDKYLEKLIEEILQ